MTTISEGTTKYLVLPGLIMISFSALSRLRSGDTSTTTTWVLKYFQIEPCAEQTIMEFLGLTMPKGTDATAKDAREIKMDERAQNAGPDLRVYRMVASREGKCTFEAGHVEA